MKNFEYAAPRTEAEAIELLSSEPGKTEILAGGTDLVGLMKKMIITPDRVVNIMDIPSLKTFDRLPDGSVHIGAAVSLEQLLDSPYLDDFAAVKQAIRGINSMQLRCQGTIGGELCQRPQCWYFRDGYNLLEGDTVAAGDNRNHAILGNSGPAKFVSGSRIAPALIALGAVVRVTGPTAKDEAFIAVEDFFRTPRHEGQRETVLQPNQLLSHILLPAAAGRSSATYEVRHGEGPEYPLAAAAASLRIEAGVVREARVVMGHVAPTPWISSEAAQAIVGKPVTPETAAAAGAAAVQRATPLSGNEHKVQLAQVAVKRAILLAAGQEIGGF